MKVKELMETLKRVDGNEEVIIGFDDDVNALIYSPLKLVGYDKDGVFLFNDESDLKLENGEEV